VSGAALFAATVVGLGGCGSPAPSGAPSADLGADPDVVAVRYAKALFAGDIATARSLTEPASQSALRLVALGIDPALVHARDLAVGSTAIGGDRAVVTLTGTLCRRSRKPSKADPSPPEDCVSNPDVHTDSPIFKVAVARQPDRLWLVTLTPLQNPGPDGGEAPSAAATSSAR
jgi:hypothetical protein